MTQSLEDYLESIYLLTRGRRVARVKDVSDAMKVKMPSVANAVRVLKKNGLVVQEKYGFIELTPAGRKEAMAILKKHETLKNFLVRVVGVSEKRADEDACAMEHYLSVETLRKIGRMVHKS
jgi:DtxR family Mn-dependent transcriptional regulator